MKETKRQQKTQESSVCILTSKLHLLTSGLSIKTLCCYGVNFIDEDDGRCVFLRQPEDVTHHPGAFAQILLDKLGANDTDEGSYKQRVRT